MDVDQLRRRAAYFRQIAAATEDDDTKEIALYLASEYETGADCVSRVAPAAPGTPSYSILGGPPGDRTVTHPYRN